MPIKESLLNIHVRLKSVTYKLSVPGPYVRSWHTDPYSFFIKVVSQASKPDDTLAWAKVGSPSCDLPRSCES